MLFVVQLPRYIQSESVVCENLSVRNFLTATCLQIFTCCLYYYNALYGIVGEIFPPRTAAHH